MNITATSSPFQTLSAVIAGLRGALGGWGARGFLDQALMFLLYRRLFVICDKIERLVLRFQAGRLVQRGPRLVVSEVVAVGADRGGSLEDTLVWPRRFGWLVRLAGYQAAGYGCQLRAVLETPEMVALLIAAPQARRILRPLCRMLAVETTLLRPRVVAEGVGDAAAACAALESGEVLRKRVRVPRPVVDWGRIPLPRGVLAAARRRGVRKGD